MAIEMVPPIDRTGPYELKAPFTTTPTTIWRCIEIREFIGLGIANSSAFETYYEPSGLTQEDCDRDEKDGVSLITLWSTTGETLFIPASYILNYPNEGALPASNILLSANLGMLGLDVDMAFIVSKVKGVLSAVVGREPEVVVHSLAVEGVLTSEEVLAMEIARKAAVTDSETDYAIRLKQEAVIADQANQIEMLKQYIIDNQP